MKDDIIGNEAVQRWLMESTTNTLITSVIIHNIATCTKRTTSNIMFIVHIWIVLHFTLKFTVCWSFITFKRSPLKWHKLILTTCLQVHNFSLEIRKHIDQLTNIILILKTFLKDISCFFSSSQPMINWTQMKMLINIQKNKCWNNAGNDSKSLTLNNSQHYN